jgi:hypothetical protein
MWALLSGRMKKSAPAAASFSASAMKIARSAWRSPRSQASSAWCIAMPVSVISGWLCGPSRLMPSSQAVR